MFRMISFIVLIEVNSYSKNSMEPLRVNNRRNLMSESVQKPKIYFGAGLFTQGAREFNARIVEQIREKGLGDVYSPAENMSINDKSGYADSITIYQADNKHLGSADILVAVLDGDVIDSGLASEIGWFARLAETTSKPKKIVGLYTDIRQGGVTDDKVEALEKLAESPFMYINLYVVGAVKSHGTVVDSVEDLLEEIKKFPK